MIIIVVVIIIMIINIITNITAVDITLSSHIEEIFFKNYLHLTSS